eukprot:1994409-Pyramimonas_sp.AAC.1
MLQALLEIHSVQQVIPENRLWMVGAMVWMLGAVAWMLGAVVWILGAVLWMLGAMVLEYTGDAPSNTCYIALVCPA